MYLHAGDSCVHGDRHQFFVNASGNTPLYYVGGSDARSIVGRSVLISDSVFTEIRVHNPIKGVRISVLRVMCYDRAKFVKRHLLLATGGAE